jgi:hypothetical protein
LQPPEIHYLEQGRSGFIVPENDLAALKEKTLLLLRDDALRARFSRNAWEDIRREASVETMFQGFLQCLTKLVSGAKKPTGGGSAVRAEAYPLARDENIFQ